MIGFLVFILLIVVSIYLIWLGVRDYSNFSSDQPWLIAKTRTARSGLKLPGSLIRPSMDGRYGLEFSYSFWIFITQWQRTDHNKHVMHKGSSDLHYMFAQAPGIFLGSDTNELVINMNTFAEPELGETMPYETHRVSDIPINKWVQVSIVVINRNLDVYINGRLKNRFKLAALPRQNFGDIFLTQMNGFDGFLSKFRYYNYALAPYQIEQIFADGPSQAPCTETGTYPPYLAGGYWFGN